MRSETTLPGLRAAPISSDGLAAERDSIFEQSLISQFYYISVYPCLMSADAQDYSSPGRCCPRFKSPAGSVSDWRAES